MHAPRSYKPTQDEEDQVMTRRTLTVGEAGRLLGISRSLAYQAARTGDLPTVKIGRRLLVPRALVERLLGEQREGVPEGSQLAV